MCSGEIANHETARASIQCALTQRCTKADIFNAGNDQGVGASSFPFGGAGTPVRAAVSRRTIGATANTIGNANTQATANARIHLPKKSGTGPRFTNVNNPDMMNAMNSDMKNAKISGAYLDGSMSCSAMKREKRGWRCRYQ